jgi:hydrogenase-4 component B
MSAGTLMLVAVALPLLGGILIWLLRKGSAAQLGVVNLFFTSLSFSLVALAWFGFGRQVVQVRLPGFLYLGLNFELTALTVFFALLFSGAWVAASIYSLKYMEHEGAQCRFYSFLLLTLTGCLGVVLAADLITLFLFFEMMTFCSWVLVIHKEDGAAMSAGNLYLYLGVVGGLVLLMGIFLLYNAVGSAAFSAIPQAVAENTGLMVAMAICFMVGFGIKAGMVPLHIWLPKAHPVAPTPASALLSGIMIKTGAFGLFRTFYAILAPAAAKGAIGHLFGWLFLGLGLTTMLLGAFLALQQRQAKRTLAYSSVSQIGYIIMGLGAALLPWGKDLYGVSGMLFHILNHAVFKTTLFMCVGAIYVYTHSLEYADLGGLLRKYPGVSIPFIIAALGIAGMPGFNGYASKTLLHHALTDLYHYNPTWVLWLAEKFFVLASALTICYFTKLFVNIFWGEKDWSHLPDRMAPTLQIPLAIGALCILAIGLFPHRVIQGIIIPAMEAVGFETKALEYAGHINVWTWSDLWGMVVTAAVAAGILFLVRKFKLDALKFPAWLSVERLLYTPLARGFLLFCLGPGVYVDRFVNKIYHGAGGLSLDFCRFVTRMDRTIDDAYDRVGAMPDLVAKASSAFDQGIDGAYTVLGGFSRNVFRAAGKVEQGINEAYDFLGGFSQKVFRAAGKVEEGLNTAYSALGKGSLKACENLDHLDQDLDSLYKSLGLVYTRAASKLDVVEQKVSQSLPRSKQAERRNWIQDLQRFLENPNWNISNLNVEAIIVALALLIVVVIFVFFGR